ncbi:competence/damage-inducible protein A [Achromobacter sp. Marseille-Q0513]|uniref:competence/damage-inducible protein A n=1 Tax=unclassified Achromobacter TaxID=2626865 RepID=UPI001B95C4A8|nr:molybdopterin-binding protein [Achromobacter sp. Marseille-Q0513]MBR8653691.1 competence/damage-inducible protein A [Achromobacter sp. Marseille-Q0513]
MAAEPAARRIGLIIVGDEILSGRRQDKHFSKVVELLSARGMQLGWAEFLPDDRDALTAAYRRSFASGDVVLSCGGIGGTPDDHTRQAAAAALDLPLALHPEAEEAIALRTAEMAAKGQGTADMSTPENQQRLQMGVFPQGCEIVPNPYNRIPGFFIRDHTFVPGFPVMAWPMLEWTLDTRYRAMQHQRSHVEHSFLVFRMPESRITPAMQTVESRWPGVRAFSLPSVGEAGGAPHIDLGVKGEPEAAAQALAFLRAEVLRLGGKLEPPAAA